jgi:hypothetical protein
MLHSHTASCAQWASQSLLGKPARSLSQICPLHWIELKFLLFSRFSLNLFKLPKFISNLIFIKKSWNQFCYSSKFMFYPMKIMIPPMVWKMSTPCGEGRGPTTSTHTFTELTTVPISQIWQPTAACHRLLDLATHRWRCGSPHRRQPPWRREATVASPAQWPIADAQREKV